MIEGSLNIRGRVSAIYAGAEDAQKSIAGKVALSFAGVSDDSTLRVPKPQVIRAGKAGGLPFDSLTSDLFLGCLPPSQICYGNCFAARAAFDAGLNFGVRVANFLDPDLFLSDIEKLPQAQAYLKNGWNSDPSWDWKMAFRLAELVRASGRHFMFLTKCFTPLDSTTAAALAKLGVELRVSVSPLDSEAQLANRLREMVAYREHGGVAVAQLFTTAFIDARLSTRQADIVDLLIDLDLPAGENSLRIDEHSPVASLLDLEFCRKLAGGRDLWSGRLFASRLLVPPITALPPSYRGLPANHMSALSADDLRGLWHEKVPTQEEVLSQVEMARPRQCGVAIDWTGVERGVERDGLVSVAGDAVGTALQIPSARGLAPLTRLNTPEAT